MLLSLCAGSALLSSLGEPGSDLTFSVFSFFFFLCFLCLLITFLAVFCFFLCGKLFLGLGRLPLPQYARWARIRMGISYKQPIEHLTRRTNMSLWAFTSYKQAVEHMTSHGPSRSSSPHHASCTQWKETRNCHDLSFQDHHAREENIRKQLNTRISCWTSQSAHITIQSVFSGVLLKTWPCSVIKCALTFFIASEGLPIPAISLKQRKCHQSRTSWINCHLLLAGYSNSSTSELPL